ncbi:four helix bundle protein [Patescibacteria group bacterium]|nr:four helix bundle protein [Patescibacteria group bacterium]MBU4099142.1 four helix bundle protein [Patescibacteria group bacterium]
MNKTSDNYNLETRTIKFSGDIIIFVSKLPKSNINNPLINQLIRSATSIGANYCEANGASSRKDFKNKIYICKKEAKETKYWLQLVSTTISEYKEQGGKLWQEAQELTLIFSKIILTLEGRSKKTI